jgi:hypothetical protein
MRLRRILEHSWKVEKLLWLPANLADSVIQLLNSTILEKLEHKKKELVHCILNFLLVFSFLIFICKN